MSKPKKRTHLDKPEEVVNPLHETLKNVIPQICDTEAGKQFFNIFCRFVEYHGPVIATDANGRLDADSTVYNDGMRNTYRRFRGYMPVEKLAEIEHGIYPYDIELEKQKNEKETK